MYYCRKVLPDPNMESKGIRITTQIHTMKRLGTLAWAVDVDNKRKAGPCVILSVLATYNVHFTSLTLCFAGQLGCW